MYSLNYKVTTSACDSEGRLKLYSALQMMQDCSEMWIDSEPSVKQYFTEQNMAQLLATRQVEIIRVPEYKEELKVTTSVYGMKPMFGFRIRVPEYKEELKVTTSVYGMKPMFGFRNTFIYDSLGNPCYKTWSMGAFVDKVAGKLKRVNCRHRLQQAREQCQLCPHGDGTVAGGLRCKRFEGRVPSGCQTR